MQRREFIVGLGAAITGSIRTDAQDLSRLSLVGYLDDCPVEGFIYSGKWNFAEGSLRSITSKVAM